MRRFGRWALAARGRLTMGAAVLAALAWAAPAAMAKNQIYWANYGSDNISFTNLDGSPGFGNLNTGTPPNNGPVNGPDGVAIDPAGGRIFWANDSFPYSIAFAKLDGSGGGTVNTGSASVNAPFGIAFDATTQTVYWANSGNNTISFARLDGSRSGDLFTGTATVLTPTGVAIDPAAGKIYWANFGSSPPKISFAFLDDVTGGGDLATVGASIHTPEGVAIDPVTNRIYWGNQSGNKVSFANLNGVGGGDVNTGSANVHFPSGVAIDPAAGKIYWVNQGDGTVAFTSLDGSSSGNLDTTGDTSTNANGPALLEVPTVAGKPVITGGKTAPAQLACSRGQWSGDLNSSLLYHAPQRFSFAWQLNGATIAGATGNTLTANTPGAYACRVTATNFAGSTTQTSGSFTVSPPPPPASASVTNATTSNFTMNVTVACHGVTGQRCSGPISLTAHEQKLGRKVVGVTARKHKHKHKHKAKPVSVQVTVGSGSYTIGAGGSVTVPIALNSTGRQLLGRFGTLHATLALVGTSAPPRVVTFTLPRIHVITGFMHWAVTIGTFTTASQLVLKPVPPGAKVKIGCQGRGCPFAKKSVQAKKKSLDVTKLFGAHHLKPGTKVTFAISAANHIGELLTYALNGRPSIGISVRCLPLGSHKPVKC